MYIDSTEKSARVPELLELKRKIDQFKDDSFIEFEGRLGFYGRSFDSDIGKDFFEKIVTTLYEYKKWNAVKRTKCTDFIKNGLRMSVNDDGEQHVVQKHRKLNLDMEYAGTPFDMRFSLSTETPVPVDKFPKTDKYECIREKNRMTFKHEHFVIDASIVDETNENGMNKQKYEIEVEVSNLKDTLSKVHGNTGYIAHCMLLKLQDLINIIEPISQESKMTIKK